MSVIMKLLGLGRIRNHNCKRDVRGYIKCNIMPVEYRDFTVFIIMVRECYHKNNRINHGMYKWGEGEDDKK